MSGATEAPPNNLTLPPPPCRQVSLATDRTTGFKYAMKSLNKQLLVSRYQVKATLAS